MRIKGLDGLRGIAFLMVYIHHIHWFWLGWPGVQLFFVMSGFLITGILLDEKDVFSAKPYFIKFYGRRILRIFPVYYFYLGVMFILTSWAIYAGFHPEPMHVFQNEVKFAATYTYDFYFALDRYIPSYFLSHFWSLSVEEQFYLVWPLLIFLVPRKHLPKAFWAVILVAPFLRILIFVLHGLETFSFLRDDLPLVVYSMPFTHLDAFALGALLTGVRRIPKAKTIFFVSIVILPIIGLVTDFLATGQWKDSSIVALGFATTMPYAYKFIWGYTLVNALCAVVIYGVVREGWAVRFLEWPPLRYLGKISYGMYVYHFAVVWFMATIFDHPITTPFPPLLALLIFVIVTVVASLSFQLMEKPITNMKSRFFTVSREIAKPPRDPDPARSPAS